MKSSLCTPTCHHNQLNSSPAFLLTIFQNIPHSLLADAHVESWMQSGAQSQALPNLCCGYFSHGGPGRGPGGCPAESFQHTGRNGRILSLRSLSTLAKERTATSREGNRLTIDRSTGGETFFEQLRRTLFIYFAFVFHGCQSSTEMDSTYSRIDDWFCTFVATSMVAIGGWTRTKPSEPAQGPCINPI